MFFFHSINTRHTINKRYDAGKKRNQIPKPTGDYLKNGFHFDLFEYAIQQKILKYWCPVGNTQCVLSAQKLEIYL